MENESWKAAGDIIAAALDFEGSERDRYLEGVTNGRPELLLEVRRYLSSFERAGSGFLEEPLIHLRPDDPTDAAIGRRIGPYSLTALLGYGGMGAVYLAERVDGAFDREVAIKLVSPGFDLGDPRTSLEHERRILARLEHPGIAKLLDAGTTEEGSPYFVMEYIAGEPIDAYCRRHRLALDKRLELIRSICAAVQYAHQNLVIHRDLKPSNILVDKGGNPHLLDFGIAKVLQPGPVPTITARGHRPMTLQYASPEQVRYESISVASDVYSLGLVLYKLLTGGNAYSLKGLSPAEIERVICEQEPLAPSAAVALAGGSDNEKARGSQKGADPEEFRERDLERVQQRLKGDLDNIVLVALRKEPRRRFGSIDQLAEDLRRSMVNLPVSARKATLPYRIRKFLKRNLVAVATTLVVVALTLAFIVSLLLQRREITAQRDEAQRLSQEVALERDSAEQVTDFLLRLFQDSNPREGKRFEITARELLDEGTERVPELDVKPRVKANLMAGVGNAYFGMGLYGKAAELYEQGLGLRRSVLGEKHLEVGELLHQIAATFEKRGLYPQAEEYFLEALPIFERALGPEDLTVAACVDYLAAVYLAQEEFETAEAHFRRALAIKRKLLGTEHRNVAGGINNLAALYREAGRYRESESLQKESIEIVRRVLGEDHPDLAMVESNLAVTYRLQGRYEESEPLLRNTLEVRLREYGPEHPWVIGSLNNLATLSRLQGRSEEAERLYLRSIETSRRTLHYKHPHLATALIGLAQLYITQGRLEGAGTRLDEALEVRTSILGPEHSGVALVLLVQADLSYALGRHSRAENLYQQALRIQEERLGAQHPVLSATLEGYAAMLRGTDRSSEAEPLERRAVDLRSRLDSSG